MTRYSQVALLCSADPVSIVNAPEEASNGVVHVIDGVLLP